MKELKKEEEQLSSKLQQYKMQKRRSERITLTLTTELVWNGMGYLGLTENLSENGLYMKICPPKTVIDFTPGKVLNLKLHLPSLEKLNLTCNVIWSYKTLPYGLNSIGVEITDLHPKYKKFFKTL